MGDMMDGIMGVGVWMMLLWGLIALVILGLAVAGAVWLARTLSHRNSPAVPGPDGPREILQRRYAAGEIDEDEYLRRLSGLDQR